MATRDQLIDELLKEYKTSEDFFGKDGLLKQLTKDLVERILQGEMGDHLGYEKHAHEGRGSGNSRNGTRGKTLKGDQGEMRLEVPRDRNGDFEPQLIPNGQSRIPGFDDKIISLYARGLTAREIQGHLEELYGVDVSATLISNITQVVLDEVKAWQSRPLDAIYPILYLDALQVKIRDEGTVRNKAIYLALGINLDGEKELLGLWISPTEGAKFWLGILTELKNRGVEDVFIACVDGLSGFPEAIETVYPQAQVQPCIVHMVRNSLKYVSWKQRKAVAADLKAIYKAATIEEAELALDAFAHTWDSQYPTISRQWREQWEPLTGFFAYPEEIRRVIYTTNAIESLNSSIRKIIKHRRVFPNDEAATKLIYLAVQNAAKKWTLPIKNWKAALNQFAILFEERLPLT
jgi:putative transposase